MPGLLFLRNSLRMATGRNRLNFGAQVEWAIFTQVEVLPK